MKLSELLPKLTFEKFVGDNYAEITTIIAANSQNTNPNALMWVSVKNKDLIHQITTGTVIVPTLDGITLHHNCNYIFTTNPRLAFAQVLKILYPDDPLRTIAATAQIATSAKIGKNVSIGNYVTIEANCVVGNNTIIDHNTIIKKNTQIGNNCFIGANCTIGGNGFGYEKGIEGNNTFIKHIGNVILEDYVEIGNNSCIDRAVLGSTILRKHVKVDNLVHIAHGVVIDENSLIIANSLIGGSTTIGKRVWVAPSATIINKTSVDDDAVIGMGAVVLKPVQKNEVIVGNPGKPIKK